MRGLIVSDQLGPGELLPSSADLAAKFGVSRTITREAMKSLQARGLIEIVNGKRARVRPITNTLLVDFFDRFAQPHRQAVIELLELRKGIEVQAASLAAERRTADDLDRLRSIVTKMEAAIGDIDAFMETDVDLHLAIVAASKNRMLFHLVGSIREALRDTIKEGLERHKTLADWRRTYLAHVKLVELIERQSAEAAGALMATHFEDATHAILTREPRPQTDASLKAPRS